jgi:hypothetical protein
MLKSVKRRDMVKAVASAHITVKKWLGSGQNPQYRRTEMILN